MVSLSRWWVTILSEIMPIRAEAWDLSCLDVLISVISYSSLRSGESLRYVQAIICWQT